MDKAQREDVFLTLINDSNFYIDYTKLGYPEKFNKDIVKPLVIEHTKRIQCTNPGLWRFKLYDHDMVNVARQIISYYKEEYDYQETKEIYKDYPLGGEIYFTANNANMLDISTLNTTQQTKENTMNKFETKHYVNNQDITSMSDEEVFESISKAEADIKKLRSIKTKSTKIEATIKAHQKFIKQVVKHLDKRV